MPILIVEDDNEINMLIAEVLSRRGYSVQQAYSGTEAVLLISQREFSMIILDLMLPGLTGEEVIKKLREKSNVPVIVLSAKSESADKISLLKLGADDYMTKPFDPDELTARVEANLRRAKMPGTQEIKQYSYKSVMLDSESRIVSLEGKPVSLTAREFDILALFMQNPNKVFTKANIYQSVWQDEFFGDDNTINVHISNLRSKLKDKDMIETVWGIGFKLKSKN